MTRYKVLNMSVNYWCSWCVRLEADAGQVLCVGFVIKHYFRVCEPNIHFHDWLRGYFQFCKRFGVKLYSWVFWTRIRILLINWEDKKSSTVCSAQNQPPFQHNAGHIVCCAQALKKDEIIYSLFVLSILYLDIFSLNKIHA